MLMSPGVRKAALIAHVTSSVGWLGAVAAFAVLAIVGLRSTNANEVTSAYVASDLVTRYMIVPLCFTALFTGLVQSLGTPWGLIRHYWVIAKLVLTVVATGLLLLHTAPVEHVASVAATRTLTAGDLRDLRVQLVGDALGALAALFTATALSVYKPRGLTVYGWRRQQQERGGGGSRSAKSDADDPGQSRGKAAPSLQPPASSATVDFTLTRDGM